MWLLSIKARIKKIQLYKKKCAINKVDPEDDNPELLALLPTRPLKVQNCITTVQALGDRDLTKFSNGII